MSEDLLTASLVDLLRAYPESGILAQLLERAQVVGPEGTSVGRSVLGDLPSLSDCQFEARAWPRWHGMEPDFVVVATRGGTTIARIVFEVKTGAAKSGTDDPTSDVAIDPRKGDQLAVYLNEALSIEPTAPAALVYLTHHALAPCEELGDSWKALRLRKRSAPFAWLAWRDVEHLLRELLSSTKGSLALDLRDAVEILQKCGLNSFRGAFRGNGVLRERPPTLFWSDAPPSRFGQYPATVGALPEPLFYGVSSHPHVRGPNAE